MILISRCLNDEVQILNLSIQMPNAMIGAQPSLAYIRLYYIIAKYIHATKQNIANPIKIGTHVCIFVFALSYNVCSKC